MGFSIAMWGLIVITAITFVFFLFLDIFVKFIDEADDEFMREMADEASRMPKYNDTE